MLETKFSIDICRPIGDKWQSKTLFLASFDPRSSIVKSVFDCRLSGVKTYIVGSQKNRLHDYHKLFLPCLNKIE